MVGAEFLAVAGGGAGGLYYEVEVLNAKGELRVGVAGTNFGSAAGVGGDACSWSCSMVGYAWHRCVERQGLAHRGGACGGGGAARETRARADAIHAVVGGRLG